MICIAKEWFLIKIIHNIISSSQGIYNIVECQMQLIEWKEQQQNSQQHNNRTTKKISTAQLNNRIKRTTTKFSTSQKKKIQLNNSQIPKEFLTCWLMLTWWLLLACCGGVRWGRGVRCGAAKPKLRLGVRVNGLWEWEWISDDLWIVRETETKREREVGGWRWKKKKNANTIWLNF